MSLLCRLLEMSRYLLTCNANLIRFVVLFSHLTPSQLEWLFSCYVHLCNKSRLHKMSIRKTYAQHGRTVWVEKGKKQASTTNRNANALCMFLFDVRYFNAPFVQLWIEEIETRKGEEQNCVQTKQRRRRRQMEKENENQSAAHSTVLS